MSSRQSRRPAARPTSERPTDMLTRVLSGPAPDAGPERLIEHLARLGPIPLTARDLIPTLERSGLLGRGGAAFPVGRKWRTVAERGAGDARILVNGAEGEPLSAKDRAVMTLRPHLILDGAALAARAVGATEIVLYVGGIHAEARASLARALAERAGKRELSPVPVSLVDAPHAYVAGEESAAVHFVNAADARPTVTPPRPFQAGIDGRPTLVQNVESLAQRSAHRPPRRRLVPAGGSRREPRHGIGHGLGRARPWRSRGRARDDSGRDRSRRRPQAWRFRGRAPGRLLRRLGLTRRGMGPRARSGGVAARRPFVRLWRGLVPAGGRVWRRRDGAHHGLHGGPERSAVRPVRVRAARDRRHDGPRRGRLRRCGRSGPDRALVRSAGRARRVPPPRRGGRPACVGPVDIRRRVPVSRSDGPLLPRGDAAKGCLMRDTTPLRLRVDRIRCDGYGMCAE